MSTERNAVITGTSISSADHGCLTAWLYLDYGDGAGQGFGGAGLYAPGSKRKRGANFAGHWLWRVLEVVGVDRWEDLSGCTCRVRGDDDGVRAIGHIVKDEWFDVGDEFRRLKEKA